MYIGVRHCIIIQTLAYRTDFQNNVWYLCTNLSLSVNFNQNAILEQIQRLYKCKQIILYQRCLVILLYNNNSDNKTDACIKNNQLSTDSNPVKYWYNVAFRDFDTRIDDYA